MPRITLWIIIFLLISCSNRQDAANQYCIDHFKLIEFFHDEGILCSHQNQIFLYNKINYRNHNNLIYTIHIDTSHQIIHEGNQIHFLPWGFLDYPRKHHCVHSFNINQFNDTIKITMNNYNQLKDSFYAGKQEVERNERTINIKVEYPNIFTLID